MSTGETVMPIRFPTRSLAREADWDSLYAELLPGVYNYFRYRVGPGPEAEDLTSETFVRAWQARDRYRSDLGAFSTWLYTIAERLARFVAELPEREREVLALKYGADLNNREIARLRGLSESNVGTMLHRSIQALRLKWFEGDEFKENVHER